MYRFFKSPKMLIKSGSGKVFVRINNTVTIIDLTVGNCEFYSEYDHDAGTWDLIRQTKNGNEWVLSSEEKQINRIMNSIYSSYESAFIRCIKKIFPYLAVICVAYVFIGTAMQALALVNNRHSETATVLSTPPLGLKREVVVAKTGTQSLDEMRDAFKKKLLENAQQATPQSAGHASSPLPLGDVVATPGGYAFNPKIEVDPVDAPVLKCLEKEKKQTLK